jgi:ketosteroid isomerase-like protein
MISIRSNLNLFAVCPLAVALMLAQGTPNTADREELQRLERAWNEAHIRGDSETLSRLWADDLEVAVPKMPVMKKGELIKFVDSGRMKFQRYETSDLNFRIYGQSAVVTGRLQRKREINGRVVEDDWRFTKVYERATDGWRVVSFHASEAPTPTN